MATIFDRSPLSRLADDLEKDRPKLPEVTPRTPADRPETTIPNCDGLMFSFGIRMAPSGLNTMKSTMIVN